MLAAVMIGVFSTVGFSSYMLLNLLFKNELLIQKRIKQFIHINTKENSAMEGSFTDRVIKPGMAKLSRFLNRITPRHYYNQMEMRIKEAGSPRGISVGGILLFQICLICISVAAAAVMLAATDIPLIKVMVVLCALLGIVSILPKYYLKHRIAERQKEIERCLPDVLDMLTVSIEAGLSFDGAVAKLVEKMTGVLVQEFSIVLKEMRVGVSKKDAFRSLLERVPVPSLVTFIGAIIQADQLGISIGNVLRIQSSLVRQKRRQKTQENAMKAPIKMLLPMIVFIFPTIFIVLLGPVLIKMMKAFAR
ncbi:MAG TPA: type II secretion system F family protein [Clostridia bacterium]|nr:type II secretion system F family protein [Clostridia bacterium]